MHNRDKKPGDKKLADITIGDILHFLKWIIITVLILLAIIVLVSVLFGLLS